MQREFKFVFQIQLTKSFLGNPILHKPFSCACNQTNPNPKPRSQTSDFAIPRRTERTGLLPSVRNSDNPAEFQQTPDDQSAIFVQNVFKHRREKPAEEMERALDRCGLVLTEDFVLNVLRRHRSDWKPAYAFFIWVCKKGGYNPGSVVYNEILDILGKMRRFDELIQVFEEMSKRVGLINEETYGVLLNRYAAAHKVEEVVAIFYKRRDYGLRIDLLSFETLLMWLCRYKHVEAAETLFNSKQHEFHPDIKTRNIILNGWCVLGNVREAKRFWNDIIQSKCRPDIYTYGTIINSLTKKGKMGTALKLFRTMWDKGCKPDVVICNCIIDALCFKKRIPEALDVFREMNERGCASNVSTYNSLIKHLCKIQRMEKAYELLTEMEGKKGGCLPNSVTYSYLLKSLKEPEEVPRLLERMERSGCKMSSDTYNLVLRLYMEWDDQERVKYMWDEMMKIGLGPDQRSYTIMIHGFFEKGRIEEGLRYFSEMKSKGMMPEPRTEMLVDSMKIKLQQGKTKRENKTDLNLAG